MAKTSLVGPGYTGRSPRNNSSRTINYFPELNSKDSSAEYSLVGTPGCHLWITAGGVVRGSHVLNGVVYIVVGNGLYSISSVGVISSQLGGENLLTSTGRVVITDNGIQPTGGSQLIISDGTAIYIYFLNVDIFTVGTSGLPVGQWAPLVWNGTVFCTVGYNTALAATSPDGLTWTTHALPSTANWNSVAWNGTVFVACGCLGSYGATTGALSSDGGTTWRAQALPSPGTGFWTGVAVVGGTGTFAMVSLSTNIGAYSVNGTFWNLITLPATAYWGGVHTSGNTCISVVNFSTVAIYTLDGITWHQIAMPNATQDWFMATYGGGTYMVLAANGYVALSTNLTSWTQYVLPHHNLGGGIYSSVTYGNGIFFALDILNGQDIYSTDGINWKVSIAPSVGADSSICWNYTDLYFCILNSSTGLSAISPSGSLFDGSNIFTNTFFSPSYTNTLLDGYFIFDVIGSGQWSVSSLLGVGGIFDPLNNFTAEAYPDTLLAVYANHGEIWLFCSMHTEVWGITGASSPLFQLVSGGVIDYGIASHYCLVGANNTLYWLATHKNGNTGEFFSVVAASGYGVVPISTPAITYLIAQIALNYGISDAWGYAFTQEGHEFVRWTFPSDNGGNGSTYQFDTSTNLWSEVMTYPYNYSNPGRHIGNTYFYFNNKHYLTSYADGKIYEMSSAFYDDFGNAITSTKISSPLDDKTMLNNTFISKVQVDVGVEALNIKNARFIVIPNGSSIALSSADGVTWAQNAFGSGQAWLAVTWNGSIFCAVCNGQDTATSPDGLTWTIHATAMPSSAAWDAIAWNGTIFCAVAGYGGATTKAAISTNGITWVAQTMPVSAAWEAIAWSGTVFCAIAYESSIAATSPDGIAWTQRSLTSVGATSWANIIWNGTVFCIIGGSYGGMLYSGTSPDGIIWTRATMPVSSTWIDIAWNGFTFCAIATGTSIVATSTDGITWVQGRLPVSGDWESITWNGSVFCVIGGYSGNSTNALTSPNGVTWTQQTLPVSAAWARVSSNYVVRDTTNTITLSYSKDGGVSFSTSLSSIGNVNVDNSRLIWYRLGAARQWQFNLTDTRIAKKVLLDAYIEVQGGTS